LAVAGGGGGIAHQQQQQQQRQQQRHVVALPVVRNAVGIAVANVVAAAADVAKTAADGHDEPPLLEEASGAAQASTARGDGGLEWVGPERLALLLTAQSFHGHPRSSGSSDNNSVSVTPPPTRPPTRPGPAGAMARTT